MPKEVRDAVYDAALADAAAGNELRVISAYTLGDSYATISTNTLAVVSLTPGSGNGDFLISNGDTSGRKLRVLIQSDISITASGTATHVAITLTTGSVVKYVTTMTSQALTSGGTVTVNPYDLEIADPT